MKRVLLVNYYGTCNEAGQPIGHSQKALQEYSNLVKEQFIVSAAISPCLTRGLNEEFEEIIPLKYDISATGMKTLFERIKDKFKLIANIRYVLKREGYDIVWFYRTDFFLFFYFFFKRKRKQPKMIGQVYQEEFVAGKLSKLLNYLYRKGALKFDGLIYTQKGMANFHSNTLYIPDYYYDEKKYGKYKNIRKKEKAVCLGTMNPYKKLEELVEAFNENGMQLEIKGYFYEKERFQKLLQIKKENITIEDVVLSEDEYYCLLAEAKYSMLPYDMEQYGCRTSGVLQESLFLNTISVAPKKLLEENEIDGIGYEKIEEMRNIQLFNETVIADNSATLLEYDRKEIQKKVVRFLDKEKE
ncbi:MAG: glycosyltransferase [Lachnospiraceae bacterium]|nr:glycosyltransferase [Lachnospiraceae bacterium]